MNLQKLQDRITELENQIEVLNRFNRKGECSQQIANAQTELEELRKQLDVEVKEIDAIDNEEDCNIGLPIYLNERRGWNVPMSTEEFMISDKKVDYKTLAIVLVNSKRRGEKVCEKDERYTYEDVEEHRYLYKGAIKENKEEIEKLSKNKIKTIQSNINKLVENGDGIIQVCIDENDKVYYKIYPCPHNEHGINGVGKYVQIDSRILKFLVNTSNSTAIKVYSTLCWATVTRNENGVITDDWGEVTYEWLAEKVGLSTKGSRGRDTIADILYSLYAVGLIEKKEEYREKDLPNGKCIQVKHQRYKINSFSEFKKIRKQGGRIIKK